MKSPLPNLQFAFVTIALAALFISPFKWKSILGWGMESWFQMALLIVLAIIEIRFLILFFFYKGVE
jgi:hypothetical protein